jgi:flagellar FliL protein
VDLETFLVNLADEGADRYAKVSIKLAVHPAEVATKVKEDELARARLRDRILTVLAAKTYEELSTPLGKEGLRKELQVQLQPLLATVLEGGEKHEGEEPVSIEELLFGDFVVQ